MSETKLTRYDINCEDIPEHCNPLIVSDNGDYCLFSDAAARDAERVAEIERLREENDRLERSEDKLCSERDDAEQAMSQAYYLVTGESPQWSNHFGYAEAHEEISDRMNVLKQALAAAEQKLAALESACRVLGEVFSVYRYYHTKAETGFSDDEWNAFAERKRAAFVAVDAHPIARQYVKEET